jgi:hypothetical protein
MKSRASSLNSNALGHCTHIWHAQSIKYVNVALMPKSSSFVFARNFFDLQPILSER